MARGAGAQCNTVEEDKETIYAHKYLHAGQNFLLQPAIFALQYKIGNEISGIGRSNLRGGDLASKRCKKATVFVYVYNPTTSRLVFSKPSPGLAPWAMQG